MTQALDYNYYLLVLRTHSWPRPIKEEASVIIASYGKKNNNKEKQVQIRITKIKEKIGLEIKLYY